MQWIPSQYTPPFIFNATLPLFGNLTHQVDLKIGYLDATIFAFVTIVEFILNGHPECEVAGELE